MGGLTGHLQDHGCCFWGFQLLSMRDGNERYFGHQIYPPTHILPLPFRSVSGNVICPIVGTPGAHIINGIYNKYEIFLKINNYNNNNVFVVV